MQVNNDEDFLFWNLNVNDILDLREAYSFKSIRMPTIPWSKNLWNSHIPQSRSILIWRMFHCKLPTYDFIMSIGISMASCCPLCCVDPESFQHLFFDCGLANDLWRWLSSLLNFSNKPSSIDGWVRIYSKPASTQATVVVAGIVINTLFQIRQTRNNVKHVNHRENAMTSKRWILHQVQLSGNH